MTMELNFRMFAGIVAGALSVIAVAVAVMVQQRRKRKWLGERPPLSRKLLRPAGWWLSEEIIKMEEKLTWRLLLALAAGAALGLCSMAAYPIFSGLLLHRFTFREMWDSPHFYIVPTLLCLSVSCFAWCVGSLASANNLNRALRYYRFGLRGEQAVAEALASKEVAAAGYVSFHDVPGDGDWNVDHVVIGPGGVLVLETKTCSKRRSMTAQQDHEVIFDGGSLHFPWRTDDKAVEQAVRNAEWVRKFIAGFSSPEVPVIPVIVVPGWKVVPKGNYSVKAMPETYLRDSYVTKLPRKLTVDELEPIRRRFEERCRTLEF